jgi:glycine/serine hydroxymethyltransferase
MQDKIIEDLIKAEHDRQSFGLEMIPSENHASSEVLEALGSVMTDKYSEGYPGQRYYGGCEFVDKVKILREIELKSYLVPTMPMFRHILALLLTKQFILHFLIPVTK